MLPRWSQGCPRGASPEDCDFHHDYHFHDDCHFHHDYLHDDEIETAWP